MATTIPDHIGKGERPEPHVGVAFLLLDGLRRPRIGGSPDVVLCALGLGSDGSSHQLSLRAVAHETEHAWRALLYDLKANGVGEDPLLICCDDHPALVRAVQAVYPDAPLQISVAHRLLALARKVDPQWRAACLAESRPIFAAADRAAAVARFREWRARWLKDAYRAVCSLEEDLSTSLTFYHFPPHLWAKIRTVNLVERVFREARRTAPPAPPEPPAPFEVTRDLDDTAVTEGTAAEGTATEEISEEHHPVQVDAPAVGQSVVEYSAVGQSAEGQSVEEARPSSNGEDYLPGAPRFDPRTNPEIVRWLEQHRRARTRRARIGAAMVVSLAGLLAGIVLARSL